MQEEAGRLKFVCLANDGVDEHMVWYSIPLCLILNFPFLVQPMERTKGF